VNASLHGAFDKQGWILVPTEVMLVEDLDRATLVCPPQHVIHEVSSLVFIYFFTSKLTVHYLSSGLF
jgi:hypothetical protein